MQRFIGAILALIGIIVIVGLVAGAAYTAGLGAAGVAVAPGTTTVVAPVAYGWYGPWFGFGFGFLHFLGFLFVIFLVFALLRFAFWGGRRGRGPGWGYGPGGWDHGQPTDGPSGDPREAWIRGRLDEWHRAAHGGAQPPAGSGTSPTGGSPASPSGPVDLPPPGAPTSAG